MLFRQASHATIIAPFIKTDALRSLLEVIPDTSVHSVRHEVAPRRSRRRRFRFGGS